MTIPGSGDVIALSIATRPGRPTPETAPITLNFLQNLTGFLAGEAIGTTKRK
jgi:hypothetical protein